MAREESGGGVLGLLWGIRASFLRYVVNLPDGRYSATGGVAMDETRRFVFPWAPLHDPTTPRRTTEEWRFRGDLRFAGHQGILFVQVAQPWLRLVGDGALVSVLDPYGEAGERVDLAAIPVLEASAPGVWRGREVRLTDAGHQLFGGVYRPGERLDPVTVTAPTNPARS